VTEIRPVGDTGLLLQLESNAAVHSVARAVRDHFGDELSEVVPGHRTVLLVWPGAVAFKQKRNCDLMALAGSATALRSEPEPRGAAPETVTIPVRYDGADLGTVAQRLAIDEHELVALHGAGEYTVAFMGFAPGFPYLIENSGSGPIAELLALPRLATPRTEVPAGSVAVAAGYCGVYPRSSPGGWNLLGRTETELFDPGREPPALLAPGTRVRFTPQ
jgi:KipI family sensor histidine kinase inhibitor